MNDTVVLDGELSLNIAMDGDASLNMELDGEPANVIKVIERDAPIYDGEYTVIPKAHDSTVLETNNKLLLNNVTVTEVPYYETHNESGFTAYIASEV